MLSFGLQTVPPRCVCIVIPCAKDSTTPLLAVMFAVHPSSVSVSRCHRVWHFDLERVACGWSPSGLFVLSPVSFFNRFFSPVRLCFFF